MNILGIMTGTSLDGMDFALVNFSENESKPNFLLLQSHFFPFEQVLKDKIREIISVELLISEFSQFNYYLSYLFNDKYWEFLDLYSIDNKDLYIFYKDNKRDLNFSLFINVKSIPMFNVWSVALAFTWLFRINP